MNKNNIKKGLIFIMDYPMTVTNQSQKSKDSNTSQDFSSKNIKKKDFEI